MKKGFACFLAICLLTTIVWNGRSLLTPPALLASAEETEEVQAEEKVQEETVEEEKVAEEKVAEEKVAEEKVAEEKIEEEKVAEEKTEEEKVAEEKTEEEKVEETTKEETVQNETSTQNVPETPALTETTGDTSGPAWIETESGRYYGGLQELLELTENGQTIFICSTDLIELSGHSIGSLSGRFAPDPEVFSSEKQVILSELDKSGRTKENVVFIWVGTADEIPKPADVLAEVIDATEDNVLEREIQVSTENYVAGESCTPVFTLSSIPELEEGMQYGIQLNDGETQTLDGNVYTPDASGSYRFVVLDGDGNLVAKSRSYEVVIEAQEEEEQEPEGEISMAQFMLAPQELSWSLTVTATDYTPDEACQPLFSLACEPELEEGMSFAVVVDGAAAQSLPGNEYAPETTGEYRFEIMDAQGQSVAASESFAVTVSSLPEETEPTPMLMMLGAPVMQMSSLIEIQVLTTDYYDGQTSDIAPTFTLSGMPEGGGYEYGVDVNGQGAYTALSNNVYTATQEGTYTLRFAIVDSATQQVQDQSGIYHLSLNFSTESDVKKQAWMTDPDDASAKLYGTLEGLLAKGSGQTIHIMTSNIIVLGQSRAALSGVTLVPDYSVFASGSHTVMVSNTSPLTNNTATGTLYVWVKDTTNAQGGTDTLTVAATPQNYTPDQWTSTLPTFALSYEPSTATGYDYAASVGGGTAFRLSQGSYTAEDQGEYTLRFMMVDALGQEFGQTTDYPVKLDTSAPVMVAQASEGYVLTVVAVDMVSGVAGISVDGGQTWDVPTAQGGGKYVCRYSGSDDYTFPIGSIQAKDAAGNVISNAQPVTLIAAKQDSGAASTAQTGASKGANGGTGGTTVSRTVSHASSTTTALTAYNAVDLVVENSTMSTLTVGDTTLDLDIKLNSAEYLVTPENYTASFTADFATSSGSSGVDTLVLSAVDNGVDLGAYSFLWEFNGAVYKKLAASGIDYLVLQVGDRVTALSTAGFSGGVRYSMYRSAGLASKEFDYSVVMGIPTPELEMNVTVEGETYPMTSSSSDEFYYYDVYTGTADLLETAFRVSAE